MLVHERGLDEPILVHVFSVQHNTQKLLDPEAWFREHLAALQHPRPDRWERWLRRGVNQWREAGLPILQSQPKENLNAHRCAECLSNLPEDATREQMAAALAQVLDADKDWPDRKKGAFREPLEKFFGDAEFLHSVASWSEGVDPLAQDWEWVRPQMTALLE